MVFEKEKKIEEIPTHDPFEKFKEFFTSVNNHDYRYVGGLVGYINYESIQYWEKINVKYNKHFPSYGIWNIYGRYNI